MNKHSHKANKIQMFWLYLLAASFFYDLPIATLSSLDRANPRLTDLATIFAILFVLPKLNLKRKVPQSFIIWASIVAWFLFCSLLWSLLWLPWAEAGRFSLFYSAKYIQSLLLVYTALLIPLADFQLRRIIYCIIAGGVFVALYAIPEYMTGETTRTLAGNRELHRAAGALLGSLGSSYHHISGVSSIAFAVSLAALTLMRTAWQKAQLVLIAFFIAWPALASGARSGLFAIAVIAILSFIQVKAARTTLIAVSFCLIAAGIAISPELRSLEPITEKSRSISRLISSEESEKNNDIISRLSSSDYNLSLYEWQGWRLPVFGGGFYVVPHSISDNLKYRVGYGIHNSYLFPLEQGGVIAFILFIVFLASLWKSLKRKKTAPNDSQEILRKATILFFITQIIAGLHGGNALWQSVGMENFSTFVLFLYFISIQDQNHRQ